MFDIEFGFSLFFHSIVRVHIFNLKGSLLFTKLFKHEALSTLYHDTKKIVCNHIETFYTVSVFIHR